MARLAARALIVLTLLATRPAHGSVCIFDALQNGTGANVRWATPPIGYLVNVSLLPAAQQAAALAAVQAAFATWQLSCTSLTFQYLGASASTTDVAGAILIYWGNDAVSWPHGASAYYYSLEWGSPTGSISKAAIGMNARDYLWSVGAGPSSIDIQSAVTQILPGALGFYVGPNPQTGSVSIAFGSLNRTLTQEHLDGARYLYFQAGTGCSQPAKPQPCATWSPPSDGGPTSPDAGGKDAKPPVDLATLVEGPPAPDAAKKDAPGADAARDAGVDLSGHDGAGGSDATPGKDTVAHADTPPAIDGASGEGALADGNGRIDHGRIDRTGGPDLPGWSLNAEGVRPAPPMGDGCACELGSAPISTRGALLMLLLLPLLLARRSRD